MNVIEVEVISNEIIKPSSPTPDHLRHYELSFLDQTSPKSYNPFVYFYDLNGDDGNSIDEISNKIKKSLSEVLTVYYPLAGRVKNDRFVDCNDEGVLYTVARVNPPCHVSEAMKNFRPSDLSELLPFKTHQLTEYAVGVQLNIFEGGGIAVGLCVLHQITDALSCLMFVKAWVDISRGEADTIARPEFVSATLFPPKEDPGFDGGANISTAIVTKRFVFDASAIEAIRAKNKNEEMTNSVEEYQRPASRVETLSAFIWSHLVAATSEECSSDSENAYAAIHAVNLRRKLDPPLPEESFGNLSRCSIVMFNGEEEYCCGYGEMVRRVREGIRNIDMEYLSKVMKEGDVNLNFLRAYARKIFMNGGMFNSFIFTSLCRFPLYEADFGWGEPAWVSSAAMCVNNVVVLMDTKTGNGVEVYISLKEEHMVKLEANHEFPKATN
ncbi:stemmadenine O-acetyltransferase-like [Humulus lupulus]|uniref:stemmadenine O-acetyltransferase-like n=1 Tax=Humulus lupulus TaxID=3486 RepID=UPI002B401AB7|nr:stemmadenine O-acetyltransferase-like [Humulus lupulus]